MNLKKSKKNKGFVLLFAVTLSSILLAIALGVSNVAFRELRFSTNARSTNDAFFAADTGIECALNYDKSPGSSFEDIDGNNLSNFECNGYDITAEESPEKFWTFSFP